MIKLLSDNITFSGRGEEQNSYPVFNNDIDGEVLFHLKFLIKV